MPFTAFEQIQSLSTYGQITRTDLAKLEGKTGQFYIFEKFPFEGDAKKLGFVLLIGKPAATIKAEILKLKAKLKVKGTCCHRAHQTQPLPGRIAAGG